MINLIPDVQANGPFMLASYGSNIALGFKGDPGFITRCFNWAVNTGVVRRGGQLAWYYEADTGRLAYICPKSLRAIKMGLFLQFQAEIIQGKEVPLKADHSRDDEWIESHHVNEIWDGAPTMEFQDLRIARLAAQRVKQFMEECVIRDSFFLRRVESHAPIFGLASKGRADVWD